MARTKKTAKRAARGKKTAKRSGARRTKVAKRRAVKRVVKRAVKRVAKRAVKRVAAPTAKSKGPSLPELPEIEGYVRSLPPPVKVIVNTLRRIVRESAPEATELFVENGPAYDANGLFARIETRDRAVLLEFLKGDRLDAPVGVLESGQGAERHVTLSSMDEVRESVLRTLVRQAVLHNLERQQPRPAPGAPMPAGPSGSAMA